jgi:diaphanous 2
LSNHLGIQHNIIVLICEINLLFFSPQVLDSKAAQNLSILLGGSLKHLSYEDVKRCILRCDIETLPDSVLQQLINYLPPPDQLKKLQDFKNQYSELTEAEQFAVTVSEIVSL